MPQSRRRFLGLAGGIGAAAASPLVRASRALAEPEPPRRKLGIALVGLGGLAGNQLAPAFEHSRLCRLAGLVSGHPDKARQWAQRYGVPERCLYSYETFDRIADDPDVDVVYVVLPNSMHAEFTIRAAKAGKHVLCEKPMAIRPADCDRMIAAAERSGKVLQIGHCVRFWPEYAKAKEIVDSGKYGKVVAAMFYNRLSIGSWRRLIR